MLGRPQKARPFFRALHIPMKCILTLLLILIPSLGSGESTNEEFNDAAIFGDFEKVNRFLKQDSSIVKAADEYGFTVLHNAVGEHYFEMIELLIKNGADVNAQNDEGIAPLHLASYSETAQILIQSGADIDIKSNKGETPLYLMAAEQDGFEVMVVLLENGANPKLKNSRGETALEAALLRGETDKVNLIKKYTND